MGAGSTNTPQTAIRPVSLAEEETAEELLDLH